MYPEDALATSSKLIEKGTRKGTHTDTSIYKKFFFLPFAIEGPLPDTFVASVRRVTNTNSPAPSVPSPQHIHISYHRLESASMRSSLIVLRFNLFEHAHKDDLQPLKELLKGNTSGERGAWCRWKSASCIRSRARSGLSW